jgi:hypothetical protein
MSLNLLWRILAFFVLLWSVLFMPWWLFLILALSGMVYFPFFLEAVFLSLLSDLLYGTPEIKLFHSVYVSFILILVCFVFLEILKKKLRLHNNK